MNLQRKLNLNRTENVTERQSDQAQCSVRDLGWKPILPVKVLTRVEKYSNYFWVCGKHIQNTTE